MDRSNSPKKAIAKSGLLASAAVITLTLLGGCENIPDNLVPPPKAMPASEPVRADWVEAQRQVPFATNDARLSPTAIAEIDGFLRRMDIGAGDRIAVSAETLGAPQTTRTLADRRRAAVVKYLESRHLPAVAADMVATGDNANVSIRIGRYVAKLPDCPEWQRLSNGASYVDSGYKNFGCLTNTALGNMVVDPGDLAGGDRTGPGDSTTMAKSVQNYHDGKLKTPTTTAGQ